MNQETLAQQCRQLLDKRQYKAALELLEKNANKFTGKLDYYLLKSEACYYLDKVDKAFTAAEAALVIAPTNAIALWCRGNAYRDKKKYTEAERDYFAAIANNPEYARPYNGLGNVYSDKKDYAKAAEYYELAISKDPDNARTYYNLGFTYYEQEDYIKSAEYFELAISKDPEDAYPYNGLGNVYSSQKDYGKATEYYELAISKDPDNAYPYNGLGNISYAKGVYTKAIAYYTKAIEKDPKEIGFFQNRGHSYYDTGEYDKAIADYEKVLELDPDDYWANLRRNEILAKRGNYKAIKPIPGEKAKDSEPKFIKELIDNKLKSEEEPLKEKLMMLGSAVAEVVNDIRKTAFKEIKEPVAHYTKLLVANIVVNKPADKSMLRYYNVAYMNDPEEGKILLKILEDMGGSRFKNIADCFEAGKRREDNNVYLGSFVPLSHQDELVMWRTYGKENNVEASGCSIIIAPEFFDGDNKPLQRDFGNSPGIAAREKEALHQVVYYDKKQTAKDKQIIADDAAGILDGLKKLTEALHAFVDLKKGKEKKENLCSVINRVVFRTLSEIRYLFKSADYSFENELRVIQYVDGENDRVQIDDTGGLPHRLYIESGQPIQPSLKKIILGPKVPNPDQWLYLEVKMKKEGYKMELEKSEVQFQ